MPRCPVTAPTHGPLDTERSTRMRPRSGEVGRRRRDLPVGWKVYGRWHDLPADLPARRAQRGAGRDPAVLRERGAAVRRPDPRRVPDVRRGRGRPAGVHRRGQASGACAGGNRRAGRGLGGRRLPRCEGRSAPPDLGPARRGRGPGGRAGGFHRCPARRPGPPGRAAGPGGAVRSGVRVPGAGGEGEVGVGLGVRPGRGPGPRLVSPGFGPRLRRGPWRTAGRCRPVPRPRGRCRPVAPPRGRRTRGGAVARRWRAR